MKLFHYNNRNVILGGTYTKNFKHRQKQISLFYSDYIYFFIIINFKKQERKEQEEEFKKKLYVL